MADVTKLIERIRVNGANVAFESGRLRIVNAAKLPEGALDFIKAHGRAIADFLDREAEFEERAAIIEFDGRAPREWAEQFARVLMQQRPAHVSDVDWSWFITRAGQIIDEAPERRAA